MSSSATSDFRRRRKLNLIKVCGNQCNLCGYNKVNSALEFHHIKPEEKSYGLASMGTCHDLQQDLQEVQKCILVCANCHREIHEDLYTQEELLNKKVYLKDIAEELIKDRDSKLEQKHYYCPECGKEITRNAHLCNECAHKQTRIVIDRPNREELKNLIRNNSFTALGKQFNVTDNAIRKWCKAVNLPYRISDIKSYSDKEWELI